MISRYLLLVRAMRACVFREFVAFNQPVLNDIAEPAIRRGLPITLSLILNVNGKIELY